MTNIRKKKDLHHMMYTFAKTKKRDSRTEKDWRHTGTLDPGCDVYSSSVCLKRQEYTICWRIRITWTGTFCGKATDTQDISISVIEKAMDGIDNDAVERCIGEFVENTRYPPMLFCDKSQWEKLYNLARAGVRDWEEKSSSGCHLLDSDQDISLPARVRMSLLPKGTLYIRTLCHDIGKLGCGGHGELAHKSKQVAGRQLRWRKSDRRKRFSRNISSDWWNVWAILVGGDTPKAYLMKRLYSRCFWKSQYQWVKRRLTESMWVYGNSDGSCGYAYQQKQKDVKIVKMFW